MIKGPAKKKVTHQINQKQILNQWFGVSRLCYNYAVNILYESEKYSFYDLRTKVIEELGESKPFTLNTPYDIKANAIKDAYTAVINAKTKCKKTKTWNKVEYRLKKDANNSIYIPKANIKTQAIYTSILSTIKSSEPFKTPKQDCRLCYNRSGYYLQVPHTAQAATFPLSKESTENQGKFGKFVSLDPGVRTFMTAFSEFGVFEFGVNDAKNLSKLQNKLKELKGSRKRKARARLYQKIQNLVDDLHWKTAKFLVTNFENIYIPYFGVKQMVMSNKITSKTKREMLTLSHSLFRSRLIHAAHKYGANVLIVNESYTSKTCTNCGTQNDNLGSSKLFKCTNCHIVIDRDFNGARNVFLRSQVDHEQIRS